MTGGQVSRHSLIWIDVDAFLGSRANEAPPVRAKAIPARAPESISVNRAGRTLMPPRP
jgi:hypothetical protein